MMRFLVPLILFIVLVGFLAVGLNRDPHEVPSPLVGKPAPAFLLPQLADPKKTFAPADMKGKVWLLNVWASWCVSCGQEHPLLVEIARAKSAPLIGIDYGVYGVPETYVIDKEGVIRYKQIGIITREGLEKKILPLIAELNK